MESTIDSTIKFLKEQLRTVDIRASHSAISVPHSRSNSADDIEMKNCTLLITIPRYVPINAHA